MEVSVKVVLFDVDAHSIAVTTPQVTYLHNRGMPRMFHIPTIKFSAVRAAQDPNSRTAQAKASSILGMKTNGPSKRAAAIDPAACPTSAPFHTRRASPWLRLTPPSLSLGNRPLERPRHTVHFGHSPTPRRSRSRPGLWVASNNYSTTSLRLAVGHAFTAGYSLRFRPSHLDHVCPCGNIFMTDIPLYISAPFMWMLYQGRITPDRQFYI
ncbi:hypothetical protein BJY52DRAFT_271548 [Lactarius psammicola]|nr:hypothetical protein BJY52DRAFT_271548 [Lactarius psammicola]